MGLFSCILLSVSISRCQLPENVQLDKKNSSGDNMFSVNVALKWGDAENRRSPEHNQLLHGTSARIVHRPAKKVQTEEAQEKLQSFRVKENEGKMKACFKL